MASSHSDAVELLKSINTTVNADCVEWCPLSGCENLLLCGTYQLQENSTANKEDATCRVGGIRLFRLDSKNVHFLSQNDGSGILDLRWYPYVVDDKSLVSSATSEGNLDLYALEANEDTWLVKLSTILLEQEGLALSLDWSCVESNYKDSVCAISTSKGNLFTVQLTKEDLKTTDQWKAHEYETWICSFDSHNKSILYSGADDCKLKAWDLRAENKKPIFILNEHTMGVTSIQSNPHKENILASGSYDENLLLWDLRKLNQSLSSLKLGGGVWKLKWEPRGTQSLAAACMHNGVHIVNCTSETSPTVATSFHSHQSLAYGISWNYEELSQTEDGICIFTLASCSFYDHNLCIWQWASNDAFAELNN